MNNHPHLAIGQEVVFVSHDKKNHKGQIVKVYNDQEAEIGWEGGGAIAKVSEEKEPNTFHFEQASPKAEHKK
jgi:hypothetical protein